MCLLLVFLLTCVSKIVGSWKNIEKYPNLIDPRLTIIITTIHLFSLKFSDRQNYIDELYTFDATLYRSLMELKSYAATNGNDVKDLCLTFSLDRPVQEEEDNGSQEERRGLVVCYVSHTHPMWKFLFCASFSKSK